MSEQNAYQQAVMEAFGIVATARENQMQFDRTINCEIVRAVDAATGQYRVKYLDGEFIAYDLSKEMKYKAGNIVLVQIPKNDMSAQKNILGLKPEDVVNEYVDVQLVQERVNKVGQPIQKIYGIEGEYFVNSESGTGIYGYADPNRVELYTNPNNDESKSELFKAYSELQTLLLISADFKIDWYNDAYPPTSGIYGLEVTFGEGNNENKYRLDSTYITGNPYKLNDWTTVYGLMSIDGSKLGDLTSIDLFVEGIVRAEAGKDTEEKPEIFVRNISLDFAEEIKEQGYTANIITPKGIYFDNTIDSLNLSAEVKFNGRTDVIESSNIEYYWYQYDGSVNTTSADFDALAGVGWKRLEANTQLINISKEKHGKYAKMRAYKLVAFYNNNKIITTIYLYNKSADTDLQYSVRARKDDNIIVLTVINPTTGALIDTENHKFTWHSIDENNLYTALGNSSEIQIPSAKILNSKTFYCDIFDENNNFIISVSKTVFDEEILTDFAVYFDTTNDGYFTYDVNGDMHLDFLTHALSFDIAWRESGNEDRPYEYKWVIPESENRMFEASSSLDWITVSKGEKPASLSYTIKSRYKLSDASSNRIILQVKVADEVYEFVKYLYFTKVGDPGTNGTSAVLRIEPKGSERALLVQNGMSLGLQCKIYYNGVIDEDAIKGFDFTWSIPVDYKNNNPFVRKDEDGAAIGALPSDFSGVITVQEAMYFMDTASENLPVFYNSIIQVKATPKTETIEQGRYLYPLIALYAVPLTNDANAVSLMPTGGKLVLYNEKGYEPQYDDSVITFDRGEDIDVAIAAKGVIAIKEGEGLMPKSQFSLPCDGAIEFTYSIDNSNYYYIQPVLSTMNAFSQGILNAWDGASLQIDNENNRVLAAQIGAGTKNTENQFSGVLLGSLYNGDNKLESTGLLGFQDGISTFGFLENGTGYIGASSIGRIEFDGTKGTITSGNYKQDESGMKINLQNGHIDAYNFKLTSKNVIINSTDTSSYFTIKDDNQNTLMNVGSLGYYLQSSDYAANKKGMRIDLRNGTLEAHSVDLAGTINASGGSIGDWLISGGSISSGNTTLNSGGIISTNTFTITDYGYIGALTGEAIVGVPTNNLGIYANNGYGIILETAGNNTIRIGDSDNCLMAYKHATDANKNHVALEAPTIYLRASDIYFQGASGDGVPETHNLYARFA